MNTSAILTQALVYLTAAVVSVPISKRLGLGSVLGYLIAGLLIGPSLLNLIGEPSQVNNVAEFGVVILLFLIGLEVQPTLLWSLRGSIFGLGGAQIVATTAAVAAVGITFFGLDWRTAVTAGAILAMSSTAIVMSMLEERGLRKGPIGAASFGVLLFQDLAVIPLFVLLPLLAPDPVSAAKAAHTGAKAVREAPDWLKPVFVLAAVAAVIVGGRYAMRPVFRFIASARLREVFTAAALLLVVAVAALMTAVGMSPALGAFLAGVMLAESEFRRELESDIEPFRGILLGLFFITVGAELDLKLFLQEPLVILGLVVLLMVGKALVMAAVAKVSGLSWRIAAGVGVGLSQGGEFAFVLIGFTLGTEVLPPDLGRLLNAVVAVSMLATPVVVLGYVRVLTLLLPGARPPAPDTDFPDGAQVIIAGFGRFGQIAGRLLAANNIPLSIMDSSLNQIELLRKFGRQQVNFGDASRLDLLEAAGARTAKLLIIAIDDREKAVEMVATAKESFPHLVILARAYDRGHAYELLGKGADFVERETYEASLALGREALKRLGMAPRRADQASDIFRRYDLKQFYKMQPLWELDDDNFIKASRQSSETLERLLAADLASLDDGLPGAGPPDPAAAPETTSAA